ncbi:MAG: sugar ABC transporter ATP-binding protein [bacterium]
MANINYLSFKNVTKRFPGVLALDDVSFDIGKGQIHALMGENGAGKSTLIKVLTGVYTRDGGEILLDGAPINMRNPKEAQHVGISTVYQEVNLIPGLSVAENIFLGREPKRWGCIDWKTINRRSHEALRWLDLDIDVNQPLASFSIAVQQMVAIARALDVKAKVLVLDEPTSSLDVPEVQRLFSAMRKLQSEGLAIIFVTHFIEQVYEIADRISVLRNGRFVGNFETACLPRLELIARMMGKDIEEVKTLSEHTREQVSAPESKTYLQTTQLGKTGSLQPFDLQIAEGEILGLAGLLGSGRTEMAHLLFGLDHADSGKLAIGGQTVNLRSPAQAIGLGVGLCSEDRKVGGIIPDLSIRENIILVLQGRRGIWRLISHKRQKTIAAEYIKALRISTADADKPIRLLSGGNQQKVLLARWMASRPRLLILDEPTRGIDVGAKFEIMRLMDSLSRESMAILFISSELEEVVRCCRRVAVLRDRRKIAELSGDQVGMHSIMATVAGKQ